jgi:hypothetical protein
MPHSVSQAIKRGVGALAGMQQADGGFPLWTGTSRWTRCSPLFSTAYVMMGAGGLLPAGNIARAVDFIRSHRRRDGLWVYDPSIDIPPDADSTACSLAALALHGDPSDLIGGVELLRGFWRPGDGPFRTWIAGGMWSLPERDDPVVNCNVLYALGLLGSPVTEPERSAATHLLARAVGGSRYYCAFATLAHAARRAGLSLDGLPAAATARPPVADLLGCVRWLCGMPAVDEETLAVILQAQRPDGSWPIAPWVTAVGQPNPFWGSPAVTTALALEALTRHATQVGDKRPDVAD